MFLLIDNYDSFTHNLAHLIGAFRPVKVVRNDAISIDDAFSAKPDAIFLSPGPGVPEAAGICVDLVNEAATRAVPVFGVCLGMQAIAQAFGGRIVRAGALMHGKTCEVRHKGGAYYDAIPSPFTATRYHSLVAEAASLPACLDVTAYADDGEIMALTHEDKPIVGVQFHPESIASEYGEQLIENFIKTAIQ
ncbi:MAG: aminodeoxychorismate/anthranilate synthase component II [Pseudomonadota bacterium]